MPTVPIVNPVGRLSPIGDQTPGQRFATPSAAFGSAQAQAAQGVAQTVSDLGDTAFRFAQQRREERDAMDVMAAMNRGQEQINDFLKLSDNAIFKRTASQARGATDETTEFMDGLGQQLLEDVPRSARPALVRMWANATDQVLNRVSTHELQQHETEKKQTIEITRDALLNRVAADPFSDELRNDALRQMEGVMGAFMVDDRLRDAMFRDFRTQLHTTAIDALSVESPENAIEYFEEHADEIEGIEQAKMRRVLQDALDDKTAFSIVDMADGQPGTQEDKREFIRNLVRDSEISVDVGDKALARLDQRFRGRRGSRSQETQEALRVANEYVTNDIDLSNVPASQRLLLSEEGLWIKLEELQRKQRAGTPIQTNPLVFFNAKQQAFRDPDAFVERDMMDLYLDGLVSFEDTETLIDLQRQVSGGRSKDATGSIATDAKVLEIMRRGVGLNTANISNEKDAQLTIDLILEYDKAVEHQKEINAGKPVTSEQRLKLAQDVIEMINDAGEPGIFGRPDVPAFQGEVNEVQLFGQRVPITPEIQGRLARALKEVDIRANPENIRALAAEAFINLEMPSDSPVEFFVRVAEEMDFDATRRQLQDIAEPIEPFSASIPSPPPQRPQERDRRPAGSALQNQAGGLALGQLIRLGEARDFFAGLFESERRSQDVPSETRTKAEQGVTADDVFDGIFSVFGVDVDEEADERRNQDKGRR